MSGGRLCRSVFGFAPEGMVNLFGRFQIVTRPFRFQNGLKGTHSLAARAQTDTNPSPMSNKPTNVDEYMATLPPEHATELQKVRDAIHKGIPGVKERISYSMPAVILEHRYNLHFAAWKQHIGMYPVVDLPAALEKKVAPYRKTENMLEFKYADGMPTELITTVAAAMAKPPAS
jgi:uncharacterized protein YdhG (YjbR/CyaY superfamily)